MAGTPDLRYLGMHVGEVVTNEDPEALCRVRVRILGLLEPASAWAWPLGVGGGTADRGIHFPPEKGAEVAVWFKEGDVDHPYYLAANWGEGEIPTPARTAGTEAHRIKIIETGNWKIKLDDRPGDNSELSIENKSTGDRIVFDGSTPGILVDAKAAVVIKALGVVSVQGGQVVIQGRVVRPGGDPI